MRRQGKHDMAMARGWLAIAVAALVAAAVLFAGCATWLPGRLEGPSATHETFQMAADGQLRHSTTRIESGSARGDGVEKLEMGALRVSSEGGDTGGMRFKGLRLPQFKPLYVVGALAVIGGGVVGYLAGWGLGLTIIGCGFALVAGTALMEQYPWVLLIPVAGAVVVAAWLLYKLSRGESALAALRAIVPALDKAEPTPGPIKATIQTTAEEAGIENVVKAAVSRVKEALKKDE